MANRVTFFRETDTGHAEGQSADMLTIKIVYHTAILELRITLEIKTNNMNEIDYARQNLNSAISLERRLLHYLVTNLTRVSMVCSR